MARIRSIKPEFWTSEKVMECSPQTRLFFIGLWNFCDDHGRHPTSAKQLKALIFPGDDISPESVRGMIDELSTNGLIELYTVEGKEYLLVTRWAHQKIDKRQDAKFPAPSSNCRDPLGERSANGIDGEDRKGKESKTASAVLDARSRPKRASRTQIEPDAQPSEADGEAAIKSGLDPPRFRDEWRKFRDHHQAKGSLMADWSAAWRNWLSNVGQFNRTGKTDESKSVHAAARRMVERVERGGDFGQRPAPYMPSRLGHVAHGDPHRLLPPGGGGES